MNVSVNSNSRQEKRAGLLAFQSKWSIASIWLVVLASTYFIIQGAIVLSDKYQRISHPHSLIYGVWIESDVAPYRAERLEINSSGIVFEGGIVATEYDFDGDYLVYQHGTEQRRFKFQNQNWNEMRLLTGNAYQPIFVKTASK